MANRFRGKVERAYPMGERRVLILEKGYEGDIEEGDWLEVETGEGALRAQVASVAWGSAFHAESPPLTLVVTGLEPTPQPGSQVRDSGT